MSREQPFTKQAFVSQIDGQECWVYQRQASHKRLSIVISIYNELASKKLRFNERLDYYQSFAYSHQDRCTLFIVDDGSTDGSREALLRFVQTNHNSFNVITIPQNGQKVGALKTALSIISSKYILSLDFDTDLVGLENIKETLTKLDDRPDYMGCAIGVFPLDNGSKVLAKYYQLGSTLERISDLLVQTAGYVHLMHGEASLYRRDVLLRLLFEHSGLFAGEDIELTLIGYRLGYKAFYETEIRALTRIPSDYVSMYKQRARWKQGHFAVRCRERDFLLDQIVQGTPLGKSTLSTLSENAMLVCFPLVISGLAVRNKVYAVRLSLIVYLFYLADLVVRLAKGFREIPDSKRSLFIVPILPLLWLLIESPCEMWAIGRWLFSRFKTGEQVNE